MSVGPIAAGQVDEYLAATLREFGAEPAKPHAPTPTIHVSPLDKHAHLRRTVDEHHQALQVHQVVLQKHADLHAVQAKAREAFKRDVDAVLNRPFLGRLRWLFLGT